MGIFFGKSKKGKKKPRDVQINTGERLGLRTVDGITYIVAYKGNDETTICERDDYDNGYVKIYQDGKRVMITLQTVSR